MHTMTLKMFLTYLELQRTYNNAPPKEATGKISVK